ncbi:hypothetical protein BDW72DRAFT_194252 [Aspergillus terricola var. indicus]
MTGHQPAVRARIKGGSRSRKGCPECRSRKIKCDEQTPQCAQCLKAGRVCRIVDSLFKPHSYTFLAQTSPESKSQNVRAVRAGDKDADEKSTQKTTPLDEEDCVVPGTEQSKPSEARTHTPNQSDRDLTAETLTGPHLPGCAQTERVSPASRSNVPEDPTNQAEETSYDRCEIAFFLRHFCEGPGQWMDLCGNPSYFSQNIVALSHRSPLVRYAACALAAKQLGQTRHPESQIRQTSAQRSMLKTLIDTKLGFTWYGAKYYEKAIQLLAHQLSSKDRGTYPRSPKHVYGLGSTPSRQPACEDDEESLSFQVIAACILCQYEDVNATIRAWSGHIDGVFRLLKPHFPEPACFHICEAIPQPARELDATFWFFVVNDMLNAFVTHRKTRVEPDDIVLWCKMGLPLDRYGNIMAETRCDWQFETILLRALIRLMCRMVNSDLGNATKWTIISKEFDRWQGNVPSSFYIPITWPPDGPNPGDSIGPCLRENCSRETWFANDICAITVAFYHMSRIILLANHPKGIAVRQNDTGNDFIGTYNSLQQELKKHALEIMAIVHSMPSERVQKYMLQPLYVAGRHLTDPQERSGLLQMLRNMGDDFGLFTDYRIRDLCDEWGMECSGIDRRDGYGIWT